jgi:phage replication initiation protein
MESNMPFIEKESKELEAVNNTTSHNMYTRNTCFIHWLSFTIKETEIEIIVQKILKLQLNEFEETSQTRPGYAKAYKHHCFDIYIFSNFATHNNGTLIEIRGSACEEKSDSLLQICSDVDSYSGNFVRIDIAVDDHVGLLDIDKFYSASVDGTWTGKFRTSSRYSSSNSDGKDVGTSVYFGSRKSNTFLRVYDKAKEAKRDDHWIRCELEIKKSNSQKAPCVRIVVASHRENLC